MDPAPHYPDDYGAFVAARGRERPPRTLGRIALGRLAWTREFRGSGGTILDVGSGSGRLMAVLAAWGFQVHGVEPSARAVDAARAAGLDVCRGTIANVSGTERFDVVVLSHVLEHVVDPVDVLADARRLLRPNGRLVVAIPNRQCLERRLFGPHWDGWDVPRHVHHFDPDTLRRLLSRCGFDVESIRFEAYGLFGRSARNAGVPAWVQRLARLLDRPLGLGLAAIGRSGAMQVIARKGIA